MERKPWLHDGEDNLSASSLRVLGAVLELTAERRPVKVRAIAHKLGWTGCGWVHHLLQRLQDAGLIDCEWGKKGTIRPRCRFTREDSACST